MMLLWNVLTGPTDDRKLVSALGYGVLAICIGFIAIAGGNTFLGPVLVGIGGWLLGLIHGFGWGRSWQYPKNDADARFANRSEGDK